MRRCGYLGCWLVRWRPVQLRQHRRNHADLITVHEHLATLAALGQVEKSDRIVRRDPGVMQQVYQAIYYALCWEHFTPKTLHDALELLSLATDAEQE